MGAAESKDIENDEQYAIIRNLAETKGPAEVAKYLKDHFKKWKEEKISFAVTGRSATGKSTFINKIRNVTAKDPEYAKAGGGNTTTEPTPYQNPKNKRVVFYDLPGVGTMEFPKETYVSSMQLMNYDYFFLFFDKVVSEDDYFLVCELINLNKKFSLVRSKIDDDMRNAAEDGKEVQEVLPEIRKKIKDQVARYEHLKNTDAIFLISSRAKDTGDWFQLVEHIQKSLPAPKFESFMYSLPSLTENVIDLKYQTLQKRIKFATAAAAGMAAIPLPGLDLVANVGILVEEVLHYISVFGLSRETLDTLDNFDRSDLSCSGFLVPGADLAKMIISQLGKFATILAVESFADIFLPIIGSIVSAGTSAVVTYNYLSRTLEDFRNDAVIVYKFILKSQKAFDLS